MEKRKAGLRVQRWPVRPLLLLMVSTAACRDVEPPPLHFEDLGMDGAVLVPTPPVWKDAAIVKGQAEWHAIPEPRIEPEAEPAAAPEATAGPGPTPQIESEIREMIADYNQVAGDGSVEDLLEYYVESQHDVLRPLFDGAVKLRSTLGELRRELSEQLPDAKERIEAAVGRLESGVKLRFPIASVSVLNETEATARLSPDSPSADGGQELRFLLQDDIWYIEVPNIEEVAAGMQAGLAAAAGALNTWLEAIRAGSGSTAGSPEAILAQLESLAEATVKPSAGTPEDGGEAEAPGP